MDQIDNFQQDKAYRRAKKRVKDLKEFYKHFLVYLLVNAIFIGRRIYNDIDQGDPWIEAFTDPGNYDFFFWWGDWIDYTCSHSVCSTQYFKQSMGRKKN